MRNVHTSVDGSANSTRDTSRDNGYSYPLREAPKNPPEETERVERIVERVIEEHSETIEQLADE